MADSNSFDIDVDALYDDDDVEVHRLTRIDPNVLGRQNFYFGKTLGEGAFARVVHAKMKNEFSPEYAIKIMEKSHIHKEKKVSYVMMEKQILSSLSHPYIIKLYYTFHDKDYLYMCMDLAAGGELSRLIQNQKDMNVAKGIAETACSIEMTQFYMAELVLALEYLHANRIIHMDLKPENVLITRDGHIKVADFGTALRIVDDQPLDDIFVGTAQYVSPEILEGSDITFSCDLWAFGCIVYQMLCGVSPFQADTEYLIFQAINNHVDGSQPIKYPASVQESAHDLVEALLKGEPSQRLGSSSEDPTLSYEALKNHTFFEEIDWANLSQITPPYIPNPSDMPDTSNMKDGAFDDWILEGEATMLDMEDIELEQQVLTKSTRTTKWSAFLNPGESLIFDALTWKRKGLFSKKRQLLLTNTPRLIYVDPDPEKMEEKGQIPWSADKPLKCVLLKGEFFDIVCTLTGRSYHFRNAGGVNSSPQVWRQYINDMNQQFA